MCRVCHAFNVSLCLQTSHCRELTLPSSDLAHKADLVCVLVPENGASAMTQPAAIAVSPEGLVRYWPSIAHEGSYLETSAELHGQECFSLTDAHVRSVLTYYILSLLSYK